MSVHARSTSKSYFKIRSRFKGIMFVEDEIEIRTHGTSIKAIYNQNLRTIAKSDECSCQSQIFELFISIRHPVCY